MRKQFGRKLKVYLDTAYERGAGDFYEQSIRPALLSSSYLIVVAPPNAIRHGGGAEDWITREIADFTAGPNGRNVIVARGAGEFSDSLPGDLAVRFPNMEIVDLRGAGPFWYFNPPRVARLTSEKLKVIAPLLDIPLEDMPKLRKEEENRQQSRVGVATGAILGVLVAVSGLSIFALQSRNQAFHSLEDSMFATGRMVLQATGLPNTDESTSNTRSLLINQGCDLIDNLSAGSGVDPAIGELVTCKLERAFDHENHGEQTEARREFETAISSASARYAHVPRSDAAERLLQAEQAYAEYFVRKKEDDAAAREYNNLLADARIFINADAFRPEYVRAEAEALGSLGDLYQARGERMKAGDSYDQAAISVRREIDLEGGNPLGKNIEWLARLYRLAGEQHRLSNDTLGALDRYHSALGARSLTSGNQDIPELDQEEATTHSLIFLTEQTSGNAAAAQKARQDALAAVDRVIKANSLSSELSQRATTLRHWLETQQTDN
jgi:hypothetical protein